MNLPKFSVITVSFNQGEFIRDNIESVLAQNYPNFEHIIVDGGSSDSTLSILKEYSHLKWTSEPDRGQSDALNKGLSRASGEIIAWLNSDDWYAPNIFFDIANALQHHPVVLGIAEQTDRSGKTTEIVQNSPRSFYDLWRYWVPYAWVAQPSIFFRKSVLEQVKRSEGRYIDEDLYFTMDSDLWMRIALQAPFSAHLAKTLSYFRIYESNKTGARPLATQRECSRIFRRFANGNEPQELPLSHIIACDQPSEELKKTVINLLAQSTTTFDIIISDYSASRADAKNMREFSLDLSEAIGHVSVRYVRAENSNLYSAYDTALRKACSPIVSFLGAGDTLTTNYTALALNTFSRDVVGAILPQIGDFKPKDILYAKSDTLDLGAMLTMPHSPITFVARRLALVELGGFANFECYPLAYRRLLVNLVFRNWAIACEESMQIIPFSTQKDLRAQSFFDKNQLSVIAFIAQELKAEQEKDPFYPIRTAIRDPQVLVDALKESPEIILARSPLDWR